MSSQDSTLNGLWKAHQHGVNQYRRIAKRSSRLQRRLKASRPRPSSWFPLLWWYSAGWRVNLIRILGNRCILMLCIKPRRPTDDYTTSLRHRPLMWEDIVTLFFFSFAMAFGLWKKNKAFIESAISKNSYQVLCNTVCDRHISSH